MSDFKFEPESGFDVRSYQNLLSNRLDGEGVDARNRLENRRAIILKTTGILVAEGVPEHLGQALFACAMARDVFACRVGEVLMGAGADPLAPDDSLTIFSIDNSSSEPLSMEPACAFAAGTFRRGQAEGFLMPVLPSFSLSLASRLDADPRVRPELWLGAMRGGVFSYVTKTVSLALPGFIRICAKNIPPSDENIRTCLSLVDEAMLSMEGGRVPSSPATDQMKNEILSIMESAAMSSNRSGNPPAKRANTPSV